MAVVMCDMYKKEEGAFFLYAVTDSKYTRSDLGLFLNQMESSLKGGVTCLQLREKGVSNEIFFKKAIIFKNYIHCFTFYNRKVPEITITESNNACNFFAFF